MTIDRICLADNILNAAEVGKKDKDEKESDASNRDCCADYGAVRRACRGVGV